MEGCELPEDVVMEILSLLPVKSLVRFSCVCKLWYDLIKNPKFIALHLSRASLRESDHLLVNRCLPDSHNHILTSHSDLETLDDLSSVHLRLPFFYQNRSVRLLGPSNGIICLTDMWKHIVLCNPATREFREIPMPQLTYPDCVRIQIDAVGFGFDPKTGDYKVIVVLKLFKRCPMSASDSWKAQVYNLSSNSWRQIETHPGANIYQSSSSTTLLNGAIHWYASLGDYDKFIVSFHMTDEVFQYIPQPDICARQQGYDKKLAVLNESLALILFDVSHSRYRYARMDEHFVIWVMKDYGVKESWTRYCKIRSLQGIEWPLVFWKDRELLLETRDGQLASCNLYDQSVKNLQVYGDATTLEVVIYSESLVSVMSERVV